MIIQGYFSLMIMILKHYGLKSLIAVVIWSGEPMINPAIIRTPSMIKHPGIK